ncbi:MAG TPA: hypothetical protein VNC78_09100 [Actinomycetota bacterium]|nr:hypothetical protein [Actinomycetota bacterium]
MRKALVLMIVGALVVGASVLPAHAAKKKKPKPAGLVQADLPLYFMSTGCPATGGNFDFLTATDSDAEVECFYTGSGIRNEIGDSTGTVGAGGNNAVTGREEATRLWDAVDGIPMTLDASKNITGSIWTQGGECPVADPAPCSPVGLGFGEVVVDIAIVGTSAGAEVIIAELSESYSVTPGSPHEIALDVDIDAALQGKVLDTFEVRTWIHGMSVGHGVIKTNGDTSSVVTVPVLRAA